MLDIIAALSLTVAVMLLAVLSYIDLRVRLLPNKYVLAFLICGLAFHSATAFRLIHPADATLGMAAGFLSLFTLRAAANHLYKQDALGLGDVKLMGAGGLWLGVDGIFLAMAIGAFTGVLHGVLAAVFEAIREKHAPRLKGLQIPAGPGFATGLVLVGAWQFRSFFGMWI